LFGMGSEKPAYLIQATDFILECLDEELANRYGAKTQAGVRDRFWRELMFIINSSGEPTEFLLSRRLLRTTRF